MSAAQTLSAPLAAAPMAASAVPGASVRPVGTPRPFGLAEQRTCHLVGRRYAPGRCAALTRWRPPRPPRRRRAWRRISSRAPPAQPGGSPDARRPGKPALQSSAPRARTRTRLGRARPSSLATRIGSRCPTRRRWRRQSSRGLQRMGGWLPRALHVPHSRTRRRAHRRCTRANARMAGQSARHGSRHRQTMHAHVQRGQCHPYP
mmetsp:Transcript_25149/g.64977  ORF Transcript_25149/g.64977 Transcript_25149/m.64977 type:complete len:204 (-) Transcript_25149:306-917(-)